MRNKVWTLAVIVAFAIVGALMATQHDARAESINESDLPQEADFCNIQFPASGNVNGGEIFPVVGQIFESGVTDSPGENVAITADVGFGPIGSDPTQEVDWTFFPAVYDGDNGSNDEYHGDIVAPSPVVTTDYAYVYRFSTDGTDQYTYCDIDGAGSNAGLDFDFAELGVLTVNGTGGGGGGAGGDVTTSVDVIADPGACILLSTNVVNYGELTFSTPFSPQGGGSFITITSCSLTATLDLFAKGSDASGPTANWNLTLPPGSRNMCDSDASGIDEFGQSVVHVPDQTVLTLDLTETNQAFTQGLGINQSLNTGVDLLMPCVGSSGTGETVSSTVTFTAVTGAPPPPTGNNPCIEAVPSIAEGVTAADNTDCQTGAGEIVSSCFGANPARHNQYFAFDLQSGQGADITIDASFDVMAALYEVGQSSVTQVACDDDSAGLSEVLSVLNSNGTSASYVLQIDGASPGQFGPYDISLVTTP